MSAKSATTIIISVALFSLTVITPTLSSAQTHEQCPGKNVSEILEHYNFPGGLFPDDVESFACTRLQIPRDTISLTIQLKGPCSVTRTRLGAMVVLEFQQMISAVLSLGHINNVVGVKADISGLIESRFTVSGATSFNYIKVIQFYSTVGIVSPPLPRLLFPDKPPACDPPAAYSASSDVVVAKNNQETPNWVLKYGGLLPAVAA